MRFDDRWITDTQLDATVRLAEGTNGLPGEVIEVGVHQGLSAIPIANAVYPGILRAVDHWDWEKAILADGRVPDLSLESLAQIGVNPDVVIRDNYGIFLSNAAEGTQGNIRVYKMGWQEFAEQWTEPIRFLHIDAVHTTEEVSGNIAALLPYAVPGAIFCGDDYTYPPVAEAVARHFTEINAGPHALWWVQL